MDFIEKFRNNLINKDITKKDINSFFGKGMFNELPKCFYNNDMDYYFFDIWDWIIKNKQNINNKWVNHFFTLFSIKSKKTQETENWFKKQNKKYNYNKASTPAFFILNKTQNNTKRFIKIPNFQYYFLHVFLFLSLKLEIKNIKFEKSLAPCMINSEYTDFKLLTLYGDGINIEEIINKNEQFFSEFKFVKIDKNLLWYDWVLLKKYDSSSLRQYCLKLDIKDFFNSIYTHIFAQDKIINFLKEELPIFIETEIVSIGEKIDQLSSWYNSNETHSIITGPFTSKISSEILLGAIDKRIEEYLLDDLKDIKFLHYVDDYYFFSDKEDLKTKIQPIFENILLEFNLSLNETKVKFDKFPVTLNINYNYMELKTLKNEIINNNKINSKICNSILNLFSNSLIKENHIDIKYCIKYIFGSINKKINIANEIAIIFISYLINLLSIRSDLSSCISEQIQIFINNLNNKEVNNFLLELLHKYLYKHIEKSNELNTIHIFYLLLIFEDNISKIEKFFKKPISSPFIIAMFLNFLRNKKIKKNSLVKKIFSINFTNNQEFQEYQNHWNSPLYYVLIEIAKYEKFIKQDILNKNIKSNLNDFNIYIIDNVEFIKFH